MMAGKIPQSFIDALLDRVDLVQLINPRVRLKKQGNRFVALCPFHHEKSPSLSVSPDKQLFYCFGCGASGNAIHFLMRYERLAFPEAVENLAHQIGLEMPDEVSDNEAKDQTRSLLRLLKQAGSLYQKALYHAESAKTYLKSRGLTGMIAKQYALGYAPDQWQFICEQLGVDKPSLALLLKAGLINVKYQRHYDRFRDRVIFPIRNPKGQIVGFGGRALGEQQPKYLNSSESPVFHKKYELYGLYEALQANTSLHELIIVEGYIDVLALAQAGIPYAVATLGTAITGFHVQKLFRYSQSIVFCFDGDTAGLQAAWRAVEITLPHLHEGLSARFLILPDSQDPDDYIKTHGTDSFLALAQRATPLSDYLFETLARDLNLQSPEGQARYAKNVMHYLNTMPHGVFQQLLYQRLSEAIDVPVHQLESIAFQSHPEQITPGQQSTQHDRTPHTSWIPDDRGLALILQNLPLAGVLCESLDNLIADNKTQRLIQQILEILKANPHITLKSLLGYFEEAQARTTLSRLAQSDLPASEQGLEADLIDYFDQLTIKQIMDLYQHKKDGPSDEQKQRLQSLLQKQKKASKR